ncbi:MAG: putative sulfate/molybdate transporter [Planctomycetota bacterium]
MTAALARTDRTASRPKHKPPPAPIPFRWGPREAAGALGDLGTFLPISLGLAVMCGMRFEAILLFAGLMNIASGWLFRQPLAVQPMKAIAAVAIAGALSPGTIAAGGLLTGAIVLGLAWVGGLDRLLRWIPPVVLRGLQLGVGLKLVWTSVDTAYADHGLDPALGWLAVVAVPLIWKATRRAPVVLVVFAVGLAMAWRQADATWSWNWPVAPLWPSNADWFDAAWLLAPAQVPLTLLNSVAAVCLLSADLFPGRGLPPKRVAVSVGWMNLLCTPLGGMPMCHGSGGLAGQHACGARTGGSAILLGLAKIGVAFALGAAAVDLLQAYPPSILHALLMLAGGALAWRGLRPCFDRPGRGTTLGACAAVAAAVFAGHTLVGVAVAAMMLRPARAAPAPHDAGAATHGDR